MNIIQNYVETMFKDLPATDDVRRLKCNILDAMEDKYNELVHKGTSENEAIGAVISQFGNIDELKEELGIANSSQDSIDDVHYVNHEEIYAYLKFKKRFAFMIALGVALCILSIISPMLANDAIFTKLISLPVKNIEAIGILIMFLMISIGVFIFIFYGTKNNCYQSFEESPLILDEKDAYEMRRQFNVFQSRHSIFIAIGVVLCILGVAITAALYELWDFDSIAIIMLSFIAISVFLFIYYGIMYSSYRLFAENHKVTKEKKKELELHSQNDHYYGITMPLAAMIYLILGFCFSAWHPGWIIFPFTAILTAAIISIKNMK